MTQPEIQKLLINQRALLLKQVKMPENFVSKKMELDEKNSLGKVNYRIQGTTAIIPITGAISRYEDFCTWMMGGTSIQCLMTDFENALANPDVRSIILDINSPGGEVDGTPEFAQMVYEAREIKPIIAYISHVGASAAYWIACAASKMIIQECSEVGSIGCYGCYYDPGSEAGEYEFVSSVSPNKIPDLSTDQGKAQIQNRINAIGEIFVKNVALYRGINVEKVLTDFGQGDVVIGNEAFRRQMVDGVGNFKAAMLLSNLRPLPQKEILMAQDPNQTTPATPAAAPPAAPASDNGMISPDMVDRKWLDQNKPDLVEQIKEEGRAEERARVGAIDNVPDAEGDSAIMQQIKKEARITKGFTSGMVAEKFLAAGLAYRQNQIALRDKDAEQVPAGAQTPETDETSEKQQMLNAAKKGFRIIGR